MATKWYIEDESERRHGPYTDYTDCVADAERMDGRIIKGDCDDDDCDEGDCDDVPGRACLNTDPVSVLRKVRAAIRCNYDPAIIAREYGAEIDAALGGPDDRGPLEDHPNQKRRLTHS